MTNDKEQMTNDGWLSKRRALWLMTAVLLTAALLRLPALEQFPPGLHYDGAANVTLAGDIGLRGERPIFISSYTGKEVLFFYLAGGLVRLLGESVFTLRLTSAFVGLLTVAVTYALGREITRHSRLVPLLAAGLLATSFWHLLFSRLGFRVITQPLMQAITLWLLLRGVRVWLDGQRPWGIFAAAGLALGLAGHTYLAVRLFPLLLVLAAVPLLPRWRELWRPLALTLALALLVLAPLLYYFATHPEAFWVRIGQVGGDGLTLGESIWRSLLMFGWRGDPYMRFNLPDMPLFNPLWAVLGVGGLLAISSKLLAVSFQRSALSTQHLYPNGYSALLLLLLNPLVMLLPTALATNEIVPSNLRALGMLPLLMFLPALGIEWLTAKAAPPNRNLLRSSAPLLLLLQALLTGWLYFGQWGTRADVFYENDGDLAAVATYLNEHMPTDQPVFVAVLHVPHPTLAALAADYDQLRLIPHGRALVLPAGGRATYIFPRNVPVPVWMRPLLPPPALLGPLGPDGEPTFALYQLDSTVLRQPSHPLTANFSHALTLTGYDVGSGASGADLPLTLYWEVAGEPAESYLTYAHLEDGTGFRWSQIEQDGYPTVFWERGDRVIQQVAVPIRAGAPPGAYRLRVGWFEPASGRPLARLDGDGRFAGNALLIENAFVLPAEAPPAVLPIPPVAWDEELWPGLRLVGVEPAPPTAVAGQPISVGLWWAAERPLPPLLVRLELIGANNVGQVLTTRPPPKAITPLPTGHRPLLWWIGKLWRYRWSWPAAVIACNSVWWGRRGWWPQLPWARWSCWKASGRLWCQRWARPWRRSLGRRFACWATIWREVS